MKRIIKMHNRPEGYPNTFIIPARRRILSFALALAVLLGGITWQSPMTLQVQAADTTASEMQEGTWVGNRRYIEFGSYNGNPIRWRVLEVKDNDSDHSGAKTAFLLADDLLRDSGGDVETRQFHNSMLNTWSTSDIRGWLNGDSAGEFLETFAANETSAILSVDLDGIGSDSDTAEVFLLSEDEARDSRYFTDSADRAAGAQWCLRSPVDFSSIYAWLVNSAGSLAGDDVYVSRGVRPALKVNLSSLIFTSVSLEYGVEIAVEDGGVPIAGARVSFSGASAPAAIFSNADGRAVFYGPFPAGDYAVTVEKAGYEPVTRSITIGEGATSHTIQLSNATYLSETVTFGRYNNTDISWKVLTMEEGKALLLAEDVVESSRPFHSSAPADWNGSDIKNWLNSNTSNNFLEQFTQWETDAMKYYGEADAQVFLLSEAELLYYLPDASMRTIPTNANWWVRPETSTSSVVLYGSSGLRNGTTQPTNSRGVRPALWVDLSGLCLNSGALASLHNATITVTNTGGSPLEGAIISLSPAAPTATATGEAINPRTDTASDGTVDFRLPEGAYTVDVTGVSGHQDGSGTLTINAAGNVTGDTIVLSLNSSPTAKTGDLTRVVAKGGFATFTADDIAEDVDAGDTLTITGIVTQPDGGIATASLSGGTVRVDGVDSGNTSVEVTVTDGGNFVDITVPIEVVVKPTVSITSMTITAGDTDTFTVWLGEGSDAADHANISSSNESVAIATPVSLGQSGPVTVRGVTRGNATISIGYSGGNWDGHTDMVQVTVTDAQVQVDFDTQGGEPQLSPITVTVGGQYPALPTVSIEGYTFDGWYTSDGSHIREGDTVTIGTDHTLHARWIGTTPTPPPVEPPIEPPPTTSSGGSSRSSDGGSSTPDSRVAKTQLPASAFSWDGDRTLTIDHERITTLGLLSMRWNDITLTRGTEFGAYEGSVIIRFSEEFIATQSPGNHTVRVEFLNHYGETAVTVGGAAAIHDADDNNHNPDTGGYPGTTGNPNTGDGRSIWTALLLGIIGCAVLVFFRGTRKMY